MTPRGALALTALLAVTAAAGFVVGASVARVALRFVYYRKDRRVPHP